jgi:C4-dicarboxylate transporter DctM subunit
MGRFRGGLAMGAILASAGFGAICGSSVATAATITSVALPEMKRHGYSGRLATGTLAAGGTLGILIPPSVPLVIYAILAEQNIAKALCCGHGTGHHRHGGLHDRHCHLCATGTRTGARKRRRAPPDDPGSPDRGTVPIMVSSPSSSGASMADCSHRRKVLASGQACTFVAALIKRELTICRKFKHCFYATAESSAMIFMIFIGADVMNSALALTQVPAQLAATVGGWGLSPLMVVSAILLFYVILGAVMDELSMLLLTIPIFFPMVIGMDFGMPKESVAIWFGIMVLMTVGFGLLAPPVGFNVYVVNSLAKDVPIAESYRGVMPFLMSDVIRTLLLLFFPGISLWLVKYMN